MLFQACSDMSTVRCNYTV